MNVSGSVVPNYGKPSYGKVEKPKCRLRPTSTVAPYQPPRKTESAYKPKETKPVAYTPKKEEPKQKPAVVPKSTGGYCDARNFDFCKGGKLNGFVPSGKYNLDQAPSTSESREYFFEVLNWLRSKSCLSPLKPDENLNKFGSVGLDYGFNHEYFGSKCSGGCPHGIGAENIGTASDKNWAEAIQVPLCKMMAEPFGTGHRGAIQNAKFTRTGLGIKCSKNECTWTNEFA